MGNLVGQKLGDYRLISLLGMGGLASVYLAKHVTLKTLAAVKVLHKQSPDEAKDDVRNQALITISLTHPHVIRVLGFGVEKDISYLVMDYAPNGTLRDRHPRGTKLPLTTILSYIRQISEALQYLHNQKLMHLDIKPENMLVGQHYEILLSDFGLTTVVPDATAENSEDIAGTIPYMAPEQFQGKPCQASDQYALGVLAYEWLCGYCPFLGSPEEIENQHLSASPLLSTEWHKRLRYDLHNKEPQFVEFTFRVIEPGPSSLIIDFYFERRWLRTIRIEFEAIEKLQPVMTSSEV